MNWTVHGPWLALVGASVGTYACRAIGVAMAGRLNPDSEFFRWLSAVTYAMVAALTVRLVVLPQGPLATVPLRLRVSLCAVSVAVMVSRPQRRLVPALLVGTLLMLGYGFTR
jgi:branched-subunit amino acid transport protein